MLLTTLPLLFTVVADAPVLARQVSNTSESVALAELLLRDERRWTRDAIRDSMARGERKVVPLETEVPVYLTYFTAWVDDEGEIHFRDDLYGVDQ